MPAVATSISSVLPVTAPHPFARRRPSSSRRAPPTATSASEFSSSSSSSSSSLSGGGGGSHIVWFRAGDLRTHDHPALTDASSCNHKKVLIPVFVFDPEECALCTPATLRVLHESVTELRVTLQSLGSDLVVRVGDPVVELPKIASAAGATSAGVHAELEWARRATHRATIVALEAAGVSCDEWSAELRESTEGSLAAAAATVKDARSVKGAPVWAFASEAAYVASRGGVAPPLPTPESLPPMREATATATEAATEKEEAAAEKEEAEEGFLGEIPSVVGVVSGGEGGCGGQWTVSLMTSHFSSPPQALSLLFCTSSVRRC